MDTQTTAANLPHKKRKPGSRELAAAALNISPRLVDAGTKVMRLGIPELQAAVINGSIRVSRAAKIADAPPAEQLALMQVRRKVAAKKPESTNLLHDRLHDLDLALQVGDHDSALRHARDLRAGADGLCMRLMPTVIEERNRLLQTPPAEVCKPDLQTERQTVLRLDASCQTVLQPKWETVSQSCEVANG